jgi:hypothetical protein
LVVLCGTIKSGVKYEGESAMVSLNDLAQLAVHELAEEVLRNPNLEIRKMALFLLREHRSHPRIQELMLYIYQRDRHYALRQLAWTLLDDPTLPEPDSTLPDTRQFSLKSWREKLQLRHQSR